ncbi:hypothetical protein HNR65_003240 [Desulfosalsimonas propionicica]|uniref:Uncharacterized protein n=1 Tax=Desulfosalsimonas propionicica TaxID=332175 RepID=A0A7W0CBW1_9BACT|nr:hypothetical protein [Desulfosalsimonas propionicica]MBA2882885.1 hypothetical protein [Desulfosalsimonas propionicica]
MNKTRTRTAQLFFTAWLLLLTLCILTLCGLPGPVRAQTPAGPDNSPRLYPDAQFFEKIGPAPVFAQNTFGGNNTRLLTEHRPSPDRASFRTMTAHKYLGYSTLALTALAAVSNSSHEIHRAASYGAAWLAGATCATGFAGYGNVINLSEGISTHDTHAVFGILGTAALVATLVIAEADNDSGHGGIGGASAAALGISVIAVKIEW